MRIIFSLILVFILSSCDHQEDQSHSIVFSGNTQKDVDFLTIGSDTVNIKDGSFTDTLSIEEDLYDYVQLNTWKWPKLIYLNKTKDLNIDFSTNTIKVTKDLLNSFLMNSDSILNSYSLRWDMEEDTFRRAIATELKSNFTIIDSVFTNSGLNQTIIEELKSIEKLKVAHRTANFISFQERKGKSIDRNIYDFMEGINLNNKRLQKQVNNRNFQYYYLLDKISDEMPDSLYPFAVIDTVNKYSSIQSIRKMIISATVKSSFYDDEVDHVRLISKYEDNFGKLQKDDPLFILREKIQKLKPGHQAPSIGELENIDGELITIADLKDKNILLTIWGTWCPYCKEELPALKNLIEKYGNTFTSVGISFDTDKNKWAEYIKENNWKGIHLIDSKRESTFKSNYLINGTNVHMLINKEGTIVSSKHIKPSSLELEEIIRKLK